MNDDMNLGATIPLPPPPAGWFDCAYAVLANGKLALVRSDRDVHTEYWRWWDEGRPPPMPDFWAGRLRISAFDEKSESGAIEVPAGQSPKVDRLPDGRWLVISDRVVRTAPDGARLYDKRNARLYTADGAPAGTFAMGDGVEYVGCAADGTIWVGYADEGYFLEADHDAGGSISAAGVARFDSDGRVLWSFYGHERAGFFYTVHCHALTLEGDTLWSCPDTDSIIRVERHVVKCWRNKSAITGAAALAVQGDDALLAGGHRGQSPRIALIRIDDDQAYPIGRWQFRLPDRCTAALLQGRGDTLHIVGHGHWTRMSVAMMREIRNRNPLPKPAQRAFEFIMTSSRDR